MTPYRLTRPPRALRRFNRHKVHLDNVALVPANLLPYKAEWQAIANRLSKDGVLIILPPDESGPMRTLKIVASLLESNGHHVTTIPAEQFAEV